ncbi:Serine/threonine-protein kinase PknH [Maioricimonas rarisocia]|uniref:Serine/threonine-protein kinase PknH n=1 Tax=Maioricimonas rarisocia TaxID=2528026 RepID=A0A517Z7Q9_9PLAN|nr:serine/threonine-protein kinase [Maioricimonas rarisocia]QDU38512.1 Serine/threonine-protein kinase PknH [Maioricimonas rarisocia]
MHPVLRQIVDLGIVRQSDLADVAERADTPTSSLELQLDSLVGAGSLTPLQARRIVDRGPKSLVLGNYVIRDRVGSGGMGDVYEAIHQRLNRRVALKVLKPELTRDDNAVRRFRREVEASARMAHPNIVTVTDAGEADGHHFYVMEFVDGVDLASLVKTCGPLDLPFAVEIARQVADGMDVVHRQNVIHRDLKPSNLLLDRNGLVAILDLGLAKFFQAEAGTTSETQLTLTGNVMGTIDYMAPEQALDTRTADERADIYALGCTVYYLLTGKPLFPESTMMKRLLAHREQPIPSLDEVCPIAPERFRDVFERMVAKSPDDRPSSMHVLKDELAACLENFDRVAFQQTAGELVEQVQRQKKEQAAKSSWRAGIRLTDSASTAADTDDGTRGRAGDTDANRTLGSAGEDPQTSRIRSVTIAMPRSRVLWSISATAILVTGIVMFPDWSPPDPAATIVDVVEEPSRRVAEVPVAPEDEIGVPAIPLDLQTPALLVFATPHLNVTPGNPPDDDLVAGLRQIVRHVGFYLEDDGDNAISLERFQGPDRQIAIDLEKHLKTLLQQAGVRIIDELDANWHIRGRFAVSLRTSDSDVEYTVSLVDSNTGREKSAFHDSFALNSAQPPGFAAPPSPAPMPPAETSHETLIAAIDALAARTKTFVAQQDAQSISVGPFEAPAAADARTFEGALIAALQQAGVRVVDAGRAPWQLRGSLSIGTTGNSPTATVEATIVENEK